MHFISFQYSSREEHGYVTSTPRYTIVMYIFIKFHIPVILSRINLQLSMSPMLANKDLTSSWDIV